MKNHLDDNASFDGCMYETFGDQVDHVFYLASARPEVVWTLLETDGVQYISAGYQRVNRLGYFITEKPWETGLEEVELPALCDDEHSE